MSLRTLERGAPSLFRQGMAPATKLTVLAVLSVMLMVADARLKLTEPVRQGVAAVLFPLQWAIMQPVNWLHGAQDYFQALSEAQQDAADARQQMVHMALRSHEAERLAEENAQLRDLLELRPRLTVPTLAAEVLYETPDSYTRRVVLDKGQVAGVEPGSPVMDESGILGQVTRVQPFSSEVTLLSDRDQVIPVMNERTGQRSVAYGDASNQRTSAMELRFMPSDADVQEGDLLVTSGVDGVYPPGLPVARVVEVERRAQSPFQRIQCEPLARMDGARHVMVLTPVNVLKAAQMPQVDGPSAAEDAVNAKTQREERSAQRRAGGSQANLPGQKEAQP